MSEIRLQQILIPQKVYIGDTAQLRVSFNSSQEALARLTANGKAALPQESDWQTDDLTIKEIFLVPAGVDFYQLEITFVPWKTGDLQMPPLHIGELLLEFEPVQIESLTETQKYGSLQESESPMLLPGTAYKIYALLIISILLLILLINLIIKHKSLVFFVKNTILVIKYKRNRKLTEKKLAALERDNSLSDKVWAEDIQKILKIYLGVKYQLDFTKKTTSEILPAIFEITGGVSEEKNEAVAALVEVFVRTDFLRFSPKQTLLENEKNGLTKKILQQIAVLEADTAGTGERQGDEQ